EEADEVGTRGVHDHSWSSDAVWRWPSALATLLHDQPRPRSTAAPLDSCSAARAVLDEADVVALGVGDERHPLVGAGRPEGVVVVTEDDVRLALDGHPGGGEPLERGVDVVDAQVEQGARGALLE